MYQQSALGWQRQWVLSYFQRVLKVKRYALPNSEVMIHQPLGGAQGQATEIAIAAKHILKTRDKLNNILSAQTGQPLEKIEQDTERDNFMSAEEAVAYGLVDQVVVRPVDIFSR